MLADTLAVAPRSMRLLPGVSLCLALLAAAVDAPCYASNRLWPVPDGTAYHHHSADVFAADAVTLPFANSPQRAYNCGALRGMDACYLPSFSSSRHERAYINFHYFFYDSEECSAVFLSEKKMPSPPPGAGWRHHTRRLAGGRRHGGGWAPCSAAARTDARRGARQTAGGAGGRFSAPFISAGEPLPAGAGQTAALAAWRSGRKEDVNARAGRAAVASGAFILGVAGTRQRAGRGRSPAALTCGMPLPAPFVLLALNRLFCWFVLN